MLLKTRVSYVIMVVWRSPRSSFLLRFCLSVQMAKARDDKHRQAQESQRVLDESAATYVHPPSLPPQPITLRVYGRGVTWNVVW